MVQPRALSQPPPVTKTVRFDPAVSFSSPSPSSPSDSRDSEGGVSIRDYRSGEGAVSPPYNSSFSNNDRSSRQNHHHRRRASQSDAPLRSPSPTSSDATVDLPPRFDKYGRRRPEKGDDPLADTLEDILNGEGPAGRIFSKFAGALGLSDGGDGDGDRDRDRDRRRRR